MVQKEQQKMLQEKLTNSRKCCEEIDRIFLGSRKKVVIL
jgi:hypothetical protein